MSEQVIKTVVIPVAGLGKRLLPLTKDTPKNLLPLAGKPLVEYMLIEAEGSGAESVVLIISPEHRARFEEYVSGAKTRFPGLNIYIREQTEPLGHGDAVLAAIDVIGSDPFLVRFPDDLFPGQPPITVFLNKAYQELQAPVVILREVPREEVHLYGVVRTEPADRSGMHRILGLVEKPPPEQAPSNLIIAAGYAFNQKVVQALLERRAEVAPHVQDSILVGDALAKMIEAGRPVYGIELDRERIDVGTLIGYLAAEERFRQLSGN